jgi:hypothetical protein
VAALAGPSVGHPQARPACNGADLRTAFTEYVRAYNGGDLATLDRLFARPPDFRWYSSPNPGLRLSGAAYNRLTLIPYFRSRHQSRDRLRDVRLNVNGTDGTLIHFAFRLRRSARDYRNGRTFTIEGKGAAACGVGSLKFVVVSFGTPRP